MNAAKRGNGSPLAELTRLHDFVGSARRRAILAILLGRAVDAAGAALAGAVLLLLFGARILSGYWLLVLFGGSFAYGLYRALHEIPSPYRFAQQADRKLGLGDALSTAWYLDASQSGAAPAGGGSARFRELVRRQGERLCGALQPAAAAPLGVPRRAWIAGLLAVAALGLLGVRYAVRGSLDLGPPLVPSFSDYIASLWQAAGLGQAKIASAAHTRPVAAPGAQSRGELADDAGDPAAGDTGDPTERQAAQPGDRSGLLDDVMEIWDDLVTRVAAEGGGGGSEDGGSAPKDSGGESVQQRGAGQGDPGGLNQGDSQDQGDAAANNPQPGDGKNNPAAHGDDDRSFDGDSGNKSSGAERKDWGRSNGDLDAHEAARLQAVAMGKIADQYAQRQTAITGEVMVEVPGSRQQTLATPYSESGARHAEGGGRIGRDEIPLIYQPYVQRYFDRLRAPTKK
jgi:hypothetical protein